MNLSTLFKNKSNKYKFLIVFSTLLIFILLSNNIHTSSKISNFAQPQLTSSSWESILQIILIIKAKIEQMISDQNVWNHNLNWVSFLDQQQGLFSLLSLWMSPLYTSSFWIVIGAIFICLILFLTILSLLRNFTSKQNSLVNYILLARNFFASFLAIFIIFASFIIVNNIVLYLLINIFNSNIFNTNLSLILFNSSFEGISNPYAFIPDLYINIGETFNLMTFSIYLKVFSIILFLLNFLFIYLYFKIILMLISSPFKVSKILNSDWSDYLIFLKQMMLVFVRILLGAVCIYLALSWSSLIQAHYTSSLLAKPMNIVLTFSLLITPLIFNIKAKKG